MADAMQMEPSCLSLERKSHAREELRFEMVARAGDGMSGDGDKWGKEL